MAGEEEEGEAFACPFGVAWYKAQFEYCLGQYTFVRSAVGVEMPHTAAHHCSYWCVAVYWLDTPFSSE